MYDGRQVPTGTPGELQTLVTKTASFSGTRLQGLGTIRELVVTLKITSHDRTTGDEVADVYITTGDGQSEWDIVHFPQIATTGAKTYTAVVKGDVLPQTVTTAGPGVAAVVSGTIKTDTAGSNEGIKTLTAGMVRHGMMGFTLGHELVSAGTTPITAYQIWFTVKN